MGKLFLSSAVLCAVLLLCESKALDEPAKLGKRDHYAFLQDRADFNEPNMEQPPFPLQEEYPLIQQNSWLQQSQPATEQDCSGGGVTYVRWGNSACPKGVDLLYAGRAAGSHYGHQGGGGNYQCVTLEPTNFAFGPGARAGSFIYGAEYQIDNVVPDNQGAHDHDVPCAACYVASRTAKIMIPGTYECPEGWTREYYGWLMAERHNHRRSTFECVDKDMDKSVGGHLNHDGALFYHVEPRCGSLPCPPYDQEKEMTCAVCTR